MSDGICDGLTNLDRPEGTISRVLESLQVPTPKNGASSITRLMVAGKSYSDEALQAIGERAPSGHTVWAFSPTPRKVSHPRLRVTHVPAENDRQFILKVASHIERFVRSQPQGSALNPYARRQYPSLGREYDLDDFIPKWDEPHTIRVDVRGVPFEMFFIPKPESGKLVVFGQDALGRASTTLPKFYRWSWGYDLNASILVLNDPSLYLDDNIGAGWWAGTRNRDYLKDAVDLIATVAADGGIASRDVLFVGASAGGHSSLNMAACMPGSRALVDIPQVDLRTYSDKRSADAAVKACLGFDSVEDVSDEYLYRIDVVERFNEEGHIPAFSYFQNMRDTTHVDAQYGRFKERLNGKIPDGSRFVEYSSFHLTKGGHSPMSRADLISAIEDDLNTF